MTPAVTITAARKLPLHQRIVWARKRKGISQERLAAMVGTTRRHMIRIEKGQHRPLPPLRARIAEATDQPESLFADDEEEEAALSSEELDLVLALTRVLRKAKVA